MWREEFQHGSYCSSPSVYKWYTLPRFTLTNALSVMSRYVLDNRWHIRVPGLPCHLRNYFSLISCWKIYDICNVLSRRKVKAKFCRNFYLLTSESKIQIRNVWNIEQIKHVLLHCYTVYDLLKMSKEYIMSLELININFQFKLW